MRASSATSTAWPGAAPVCAATAKCKPPAATGYPVPGPCPGPRRATRKPVNPPGPWPNATACSAGASPPRPAVRRPWAARSACSWDPSCSRTVTSSRPSAARNRATPQRGDEVSRASRFSSIGAGVRSGAALTRREGDFNQGSQCVISCERPLAAGSCHCYISGHEHSKHHPTRKILVVDDDPRCAICCAGTCPSRDSTSSSPKTRKISKLWQREHFDLLVLDLCCPARWPVHLPPAARWP